ncbi:Amino acid permease [Microbotryomycetes sp. JL201]|nr:Amino acid permease [Microbotryomycetes sp. JL201]
MSISDGSLEKRESPVASKEQAETQTSTQAAPALYDPSKESRFTRLGLNVESFKKAPGSTGGIITHGSAQVVDPLAEGHNPMLQQQMKTRHLQMIAVGGSIGTGLFIGTGQALVNGGPAAILIAWLIIGVMLINVTQALGEMCILYPVSGGFYTLAIRFLDPGFGLAMGWNYLFQWVVTLPLEITAAGIVVQYWTDAVPLAAWITIFWFLIIFVNIFGALGFAEGEFWASCLKLLVVVVFLFIGVIMNCGGGPSSGLYSEYIGGRFWRDPGAFANGFKGLCSVFVTAAFSFAGTELVGLAATETPNPRVTLPKAVKGTFWRITVIYIASILIIGLNVPWNDPSLADGDDGTARTSPFVVMLKLANIDGLDHLMNATICVSVISIGLASVYAGSRVLMALAEVGHAPRIFAYVDKAGRPTWSVLFNLAWGPIAYISVSATGGTVFDWLLAISGLSTLFTWASICLSHIRFRKAWAVQGHSVDELPYRALGGVYGSWLGFILICLVLIAQFYVAVWPIGGINPDPKGAAKDFFQTWLALPVLLVMWIAAAILMGTKPLKASEIDLDTGRKAWYTASEMEAYRAERRNAPWHIRIWRILFSH